MPDGNAIILIAPPAEIDYWRELLTRFDEREAVQTRGYAPNQYGVSEVSRLIEQTVRTPSPWGSGERWRVIPDDLTGTLIITATPSEHEQIQELINRLESSPRQARRPVRAFTIRNRNARELIEVLSRLVDAGILDEGEGLGSVESPSARPASTNNPAGNSTAAASQRRDHARLQLTADEISNTVIAIGDSRRLGQLEHLIKTLDRRQPQVMIEVLVISLNETQALVSAGR